MNLAPEITLFLLRVVAGLLFLLPRRVASARPPRLLRPRRASGRTFVLNSHSGKSGPFGSGFRTLADDGSVLGGAAPH